MIAYCRSAILPHRLRAELPHEGAKGLPPKSHLYAEGEITMPFYYHGTYALFYIRDPAVNHVTCGMTKDGIVDYDEQFPGQLRAHYAGREGWLYACEENDFTPGSDPWIVTAKHPAPIASVEYIADAFEAIQREIEAGAVRVKRYEDKSEAQKRDITGMTAWVILKNGHLRADTPKARFYARSFPEAWALALENETKAREYIARWEKEHLEKR